MKKVLLVLLLLPVFAYAACPSFTAIKTGYEHNQDDITHKVIDICNIRAIKDKPRSDKKVIAYVDGFSSSVFLYDNGEYTKLVSILPKALKDKSIKCPSFLEVKNGIWINLCTLGRSGPNLRFGNYEIPHIGHVTEEEFRDFLEYLPQASKSKSQSVIFEQDQ